MCSRQQNTKFSESNDSGKQLNKKSNARKVQETKLAVTIPSPAAAGGGGSNSGSDSDDGGGGAGGGGDAG